MSMELLKRNISSLLTSTSASISQNEKMRKLFCEVMCVLCEAKKKHCYNNVNVKKEDFDLTQMTERFKAPNVKYAEEIFMKDESFLLLITNSA